jgi:hypothetical protein
MKDFSRVFRQITRFAQYLGAESSPASASQAGSLLLIAAALLRGIILALVAGLALWIVRHPFLSPLLATIAVSLTRGYLLNWHDRLVPWRLLLLYFPGLAESGRDAADRQFQASLMNWVLLIRPALYFFILQSGCWYWLIPISVLAAAFGYELTSHSESGKPEWQPWLMAIVVTVLLLLAGKSHSLGLNYFPVGLLSCVAIWLLATWVKRLPLRPKEIVGATYLGELTVCLFFLLGIAF